MRTLITGARGFTAKHLMRVLPGDSQSELFLSDLPDGNDSDDLIACDLTDAEQVHGLIRRIRPNRVYHLAGTFTNCYETDYAANVSSTRLLCDALVALEWPCRVFLVGSAGEYGWVDEADNPIREDHPLRPVSIYGLTKTFQTQLMIYYSLTHGLDMVMARTFNLIGPGISNRLFYGRLMGQIAAYRQGGIDKIVLGNLDGKRDFIAIDDAVKFYRIIMEQGDSGHVYNVGQGKSVRIRDMVEDTLKRFGLDMTCVQSVVIRQEHKLDIRDIRADITKLRALATTRSGS